MALCVPCVLLGERVRIRNALLLVASYALYAWWDGVMLLLLLGTTLVTYAVGRKLEISHQKHLWMWLGIAYALGVLVLMKYAGFFESTLPFLSLRTVLPIGLSFYTFSAISYMVDVRRGTQKAEHSLADIALFLAFFPKMLAGPIERAGNFLPQLQTPTILTRRTLIEAAFLLTWGFVLKNVIADNAAAVSAHLYEHSGGNRVGFGGVLALPLHIFGDFAGYSMMAMGAALLVGIRLQWNFHFPYAARNPSEFWRHWHISLSEWFRDYVYIPLGGSRQGLFHTICNLLITMTLVGVWHGSQWMFVLWGAFHGILLAAHHVVRRWKTPRSNTWWWKTIATALCFLAVTFSWMIFQSATPADLVHVIHQILTSPLDGYLLFVLALWIPVLVMAFAEWKMKDLLAVAHGPLWMKLTFVIFAYYAITLLSPSSAAPFLYVQF